jgi:hypothetical protein
MKLKPSVSGARDPSGYRSEQIGLTAEITHLVFFPARPSAGQNTGAVFMVDKEITAGAHGAL